MSWPDAVDDSWPDDHTTEHDALYQQVRREAQVPVPEPKTAWFAEGPTASARIEGVARQYLTPPRPRPAPRRRRPAA